ncbi:MAG TPA: hypothetical protein VHL53_05705, partial [Acidimicrobiia bacterium]|nr:hypothetical protein [Acidimicrobiia bacterium]
VTVAALGLGLGLSACGGSGGGPTAAGPETQQGAVAPAVGVAQNPDQGSILVDAKGRTLYLFEKDNGTTSACTGSCAQIWPAVTAGDHPSAGTGLDATRLGTADGQVAGQVTYAGHLLYTYAGDAAPGDVKGISIPGWYPVSPTGDKVDHDAADGGASGSGDLGY